MNTADRSAQDLVKALLDDAKMTPQEVSEALEGRVSSRTIYRWAKGESVPQNATDHEALQSLYGEKCS